MRLSIALMRTRRIAPARMYVGTMLGATLNTADLMDTDILTPTRTMGITGDIITTIGHGDGRPMVMESGSSSFADLGPATSTRNTSKVLFYFFHHADNR